MKNKGGIIEQNRPIFKYANTKLGGDVLKQDDMQGTSTGGAADSNMHSPINEIAVDHIDNFLVKIGGAILKGREATENLLMSKVDSYLDTDYANKHFIFKNCRELSSNLREYFEKKISSQIGKDKIENTKGIFIETESQSSKRMFEELVKNDDFMQKVSSLQETMKNGNSVETTVEFNDKNFHNAIGKADVQQMHIDNKGNLDLLCNRCLRF